MNKKLKTSLNTILFLVIGVALFIWATSNVGLDQLIQDIKEADAKWIALSMFCGILSHLFRALRWKLLIEPMNFKATSAGAFHSTIVGYMVNMAVPRLGEVTRPAMLSKLEDIPFNKLVGTVLLERIVDLIITLLIAVAIVFMQFQLIADFLNELVASGGDNLVKYGIGIGLFFILFALGIRYRKWIYKLPIISKFKGFFEGVVDGLKTITQLKKKGMFIAYSLLIWFMYFLMPYFVLFALEGTSHLGAAAGLTVLLFGTFAMIIPVPGGLGTFEVLVPAALALYGVVGAIGESYAIITHAVQVILILAVGLISVGYFVIKSQKKKKNGVVTDHS
ncbi:MAG: flippase-like domain-containing protein [Bacteroidia bacterium]